MLGSRILHAGKNSHEMIGSFSHSAIPLNGARFLRLDITDRSDTLSLVDSERPSVVIHTAALTDVDLCENMKQEAWNVNVEGTRYVAEAARTVGAKFVFISTDYVFDGGSGPYKEDATPNPQNYYGLAKLEGEKIASEIQNGLIIRSTVIFGWNPARKHNFASWIIQQLERGNKVKAVTDQYGTPTFADNAADVILRLVESNRSGIYNVAGRELVNRFDFANAIADSFDLRSELIDPVTTAELGQKAKRPLAGGLVCDKVERDLNVKMMSISVALSIMKKQRNVTT